jgi:hypothetical protein
VQRDDGRRRRRRRRRRRLSLLVIIEGDPLNTQHRTSAVQAYLSSKSEQIS